MAGFIEGVQRSQTVPFPEQLEDWIGEDDLVRVVAGTCLGTGSRR